MLPSFPPLTSHFSLLNHQILHHEERDDQAIGQFQSGAGEEAEEGAPRGAECRFVFFAADKLAGQRPDKRPEDDAQQTLRAERQADDGNHQSDVAAPDAGFAAAVLLGTQRWEYEVHYRDDSGHHGRDDKEGNTILSGRGKVQQQQSDPAQGRSGQGGNYGTRNAQEHQYHSQYNE